MILQQIGHSNAQVCLVCALLFIAAFTFAAQPSNGSQDTNDVASQAIPMDQEGAVFSKARNNLRVVFPSRKGVIPADEPIAITFTPITNQNVEVFRLAPEYGYRISARTANGEYIGPTRLGEAYGAKFGDVKTYSHDVLDWKGEVYELTQIGESRRWVKTSYYNGGRPFMMRIQSRRAPPVRVLPAPEDLFPLRKPGSYELWIEVQCISRDTADPPTNRSVVRFPPVKLEVRKE